MATVRLTEACSLSNKRIEQRARSCNRLNAYAPLLIRNNVGQTGLHASAKPRSGRGRLRTRGHAVEHGASDGTGGLHG
jgi:hypothetical protein